MSAQGKHVSGTDEGAVDRRDPGDDYLARETESNRRGEFWLLGVAALAGVFVVALVVIREVFFV